MKSTTSQSRLVNYLYRLLAKKFSVFHWKPKDQFVDVFREFHVRVEREIGQ